MSNRSGIAEQVLSIPKGGRVLKGLGDTFSAGLHMSTGNFGIPNPTA